MLKLLKCIALVLLTLVAHSTATAQKANEDQMARDARSPYLSSRMSAGETQARIQERHAAIRVRAGSAPEREMSVTVVFNKGLSVADVKKLVDRYQLEIVDIHLKAPYNDKGVIQSFDVGSSELVRYRGDFEQRANKAIGAIRYQLITMAETMPPDVAAAYTEIAKSEILVYRIEAYSRSKKIADLLDDFDVGLIVAESEERGDKKIAGHKQAMARATELWRRVPQGSSTRTKLDPGCMKVECEQ